MDRWLEWLGFSLAPSLSALPFWFFLGWCWKGPQNCWGMVVLVGKEQHQKKGTLNKDTPRVESQCHESNRKEREDKIRLP